MQMYQNARHTLMITLTLDSCMGGWTYLVSRAFPGKPITCYEYFMSLVDNAQLSLHCLSLVKEASMLIKGTHCVDTLIFHLVYGKQYNYETSGLYCREC